MPLSSTGCYTWTRSQLRHHRPTRIRATLTIVTFWVVIGSAYAVLLERVTHYPTPCHTDTECENPEARWNFPN